MDSYIETQFLNHNHDQNQQQNSGLLRFRSAPSSVLNEFIPNSNDSGNFNGRTRDEFVESYERKPERLNSQSGFLSSIQIVGDEQRNDSSQLPPQYPKQIHVNTSSSMERSNSMEINLSMRQGSCGLNLNRQNSSPAGFFNQLSTQNGIFFSILVILIP